jgi:hypothetical protein
MKFLFAVICLSLFCCSDGKTPQDDATTRDAEAYPAEGDASEPSDDGSQVDAKAPVTRRDAAVPVADSGSSEKDADATSDAGAPLDDAGIGDGGSSGAAGCEGLKFCDDFEGAQLDPGWEDKQGTLELDSSKTMRGQKSLHVKTVNNKPAIMAHRGSFPMPNERFWMRMFVNIKNLPSPNWAHWSIMWVIPEGKQWSVVEHRLGGQNTTDKKLYWGVGTNNGSSGDWTNIDTSSTVKLDEWQCVEVMIDANQDVSQVFREGVEIPALGTTKATKHGGNSNVPYDIPPVRTLWIGFFYYQGETPNQSYDVWIDSFALDAERIGCDR